MLGCSAAFRAEYTPPNAALFAASARIEAVSQAMRRWATWAVIGVVLGLVLGFAIGWWVWPVQYTNTAPGALRQDHRDDYIVMVATAYEVEGNLEQARERLGLLDAEGSAALVVELAERLVEAGGDTEDITLLARLARALGATTPVLDSYLENSP